MFDTYRRFRPIGLCIALVLISAGCTESRTNGNGSLSATTVSAVVEAEQGNAVLQVEVADADSESATGSEAEPALDEVPTVPEGTSAWVVVAAGATDPFDVVLTRAVEQLSALGYEARITNCDQGSAEAIGMAASSSFTVTVEFDSEQAANDAVVALADNQIDVVAVEITVACPE